MLRRVVPLVLALLATPAAAEVVQSSAAGFEVRATIVVAAPVERVWPILTAPRLWWGKDYTYSDDPANLTLDERPGGCFCERLPGKGGVEHMRVVYIQPPRMIRMTGALGPLQAEAADGTMAITLTKDGEGTSVALTYLAGGYIRAGADKLAPVIDRVLLLQLAGLKAAVERGPAAAARATPVKPLGAAEPLPPAPAGEGMADVAQTISGLEQTPATNPAVDGPPAPLDPPRPRPADQDSPR